VRVSAGGDISTERVHDGRAHDLDAAVVFRCIACDSESTLGFLGYRGTVALVGSIVPTRELDRLAVETLSKSGPGKHGAARAEITPEF